MPSLLPPALLPLAASLLAAPLAAQINEATLAGSTSTDQDRFGRAVAIDGDLMVVGALAHDGGLGFNAGAAYVFERTGNQWTEVQALSDPELDAVDRFGISVAIDGERIVVGANVDENAMGDNVGVTYVFDRIGGTWIRTARLTDESIDFVAEIGFSVAVDGNLVVAGAPGGPGAVYVWSVGSDGSSVLLDRIEDANGSGGDDFGYSVALEGTSLVVGSIGNDAFGNSAGSAFFYDILGTAQFRGQFGPSGAAPQADFGWDVDIDGDLAVIGAGAENGPLGSDSGAAYVYRRAGGAWAEEQRIEAPFGETGELFGRAVAVSGDRILVGSERGNNDEGEAVVFLEGANGWRAANAFISSDGSGDGRFGSAVALSGDRMVIGAPSDDVAGTNSGSARAYDVGTLLAGPAVIDLFDGGTQLLTVEAGAAHAGQLYAILGSRSGTAPGLVVDGLLLPLNVDTYFLKTFQAPNTPPLANSLGSLDGNGRAFASFSLPPGSDSALAGITADHAALAIDLQSLVVDFTSNPKGVELVP